MKPCETLTEDLKAYLDGELPVVRRVELRLHLLRCPACRKEIEAMEQISNELRGGEPAGLETALRAKLVAGIPDALPETPAEPGKWRRWKVKVKPKLAWGAVAVACIAWFAFNATGNLRQAAFAPSANSQVAMGTKSIPQAAGKSYSSGKEMMDMETDPATSGEKQTTVVKPAPSVHRVGSMMAKMTGGGDTPGGGGVGGKVADSTKSVAPANPLLNQERAAGRAKPMLPLPADHDQQKSILFVQGLQRQVKKEASLTLQVDKLEEKSETVEQMVKQIGGFVASNELTTGEDGVKSASLTTRVPVAQFDDFLSKVSKLGEVKAKSVNGEDITEQMSDEKQAHRALTEEIADAEAQLKDARSKAQRREDRDNVRDLRVQAAQAQGRLELLKKMAALSTVTIELREKPKNPPAVKPTGGFLDEISDTAHAAGQSFMTAARLPILLLVWLVAYAPIWIVLLLAYRYVARA